VRLTGTSYPLTCWEKADGENSTCPFSQTAALETRFLPSESPFARCSTKGGSKRSVENSRTTVTGAPVLRAKTSGPNALLRHDEAGLCSDSTGDGRASHTAPNASATLSTSAAFDHVTVSTPHLLCLGWSPEAPLARAPLTDPSIATAKVTLR
jgi:hypothetical protein